MKRFNREPTAPALSPDHDRHSHKITSFLFENANTCFSTAEICCRSSSVNSPAPAFAGSMLYHPKFTP